MREEAVVRSSARSELPKLCGADVELGNFIMGSDTFRSTCLSAARALLREIDGVSRSAYYGWRSPEVAGGGSAYGAQGGYSSYGGGYGDTYDPRDMDRKFLENGGCAYIDLGHLEVCVPEVLSARDHVAAWHAMLRIAARALAAANGRMSPGQQIQLLADNSDGRGQSWGGHLNFLLTRRAYDNIFRRRPHHALFLAAYQISSIVFAGQGKVGSENGSPDVSFQLSARADFMETFVGEQTTYARPIVNSRDEPLCGRSVASTGAPDMARLHVIFYDSNLNQTACFLKVGVMQIVLAMIEAERVKYDLALEDPLEAVRRWSHDPSLEARARTLAGRSLSAIELQLEFLEQARRFAAGARLKGLVPDAEEILDLWEATLLMLEKGDIDALACRLDWPLKLLILERAMTEHEGLDWCSPEIEHLSRAYASLDPDAGLYLAFERSGSLERIVPEARIKHFISDPPEDTRAYCRAMLLRMGRHRVEEVNWDQIRFRGAWGSRVLDLPDPLNPNREATAAARDGSNSLDEALDRLGVAPELGWMPQQTQ